jgi:adenine-specific DNA methylase
MSQRIHRAFNALPPIPGGKRSLATSIFTKLRTAVPPTDFSSLRFIDAFAGGGAISLMAKAYGVQALYSNDWSLRTQAVIQGLLQNDRIYFTDWYLCALIQENDLPDGFVVTEFPEFFSVRHAQALDQVFQAIQGVHCPIKKAMGRVLLTHLVMDFSCFGTSVGGSNRPFVEVLNGQASWEGLNPKRLQDGSFKKLLFPARQVIQKRVKTINDGVFASSTQVYGSQMDVFEFIPSIQGDVLYLDPPYPNTLSYEKLNVILDQILLGKTLPQQNPVSPFTQDSDALYELLLKARHIPIWLISLNNKVFSLEELKALVQRADPYRTVQGWARAYKHMAHVSKTQNNQELLIMAVSPEWKGVGLCK